MQVGNHLYEPPEWAAQGEWIAVGGQALQGDKGPLFVIAGWD